MTPISAISVRGTFPYEQVPTQSVDTGQKISTEAILLCDVLATVTVIATSLFIVKKRK